MCDDSLLDDLARAGVTRRRFGGLSAAAVALMAGFAEAGELTESDVLIATPDGQCDAFFVHPATGRSPAVLIWPDILGLRPTFRQMGRRLAAQGYAVLVVNPYYRSRKAPVVPDGASFADEATRSVVRPLAGTLNATTQTTDAKALIAWLDAQPAVDTGKRIGATGYCMGGAMVMRTAAASERVGAGATFHGGGIATEAPDSPHLLVPQMSASFLHAIADNDHGKDPAAKGRLEAAYAAAKLPAEIEVYVGATHGWTVPDAPAYQEAAAEKAWSRLLVLLQTLRGA